MPIKQTLGLVVLVILLVFLAYLLFFKGTAHANTIFDLLKNLIGTSLKTEGRVLYIYMDPPEKEMYEFFITDELKMPAEVKGGYYDMDKGVNEWFMVKPPPGYDDKCLIYTVDEEDDWKLLFVLWAINRDKGFVYYVPSGTIIDDNCNGASLGGCLSPFSSQIEKGCLDNPPEAASYPFSNDVANDIQKCYDGLKGKFNFVNCFGRLHIEQCDSPSNLEVETVSFGTNWQFKGPPTNAFKTGCELENGKIKNPQTCGLLVPGAYQIKYGLICDGGKWKVCTEKTDPKTYALGNTNCKCVCSGTGDDAICEWSGCTPSDFSGTLNINPNPAPAGGTINIEITGQTTAGRVMYMLWVLNPDETVEKCYCGTSNTPQCSNPGVYSCSNTFKITAMSGTFQAMVYDSKPDGSNILAVATTPPAIDVTVQ